EPCPVAAVGVVLAGEEVAVLVERQLLRVPETAREDLEPRPVGPATQDAPLVGIIDGLAAGSDVHPSVAEAEVEPAVGSEAEAVEVVAPVGAVDAAARVERPLHLRAP